MAMPLRLLLTGLSLLLALSMGPGSLSAQTIDEETGELLFEPEDEESGGERKGDRNEESSGERDRRREGESRDRRRGDRDEGKRRRGDREEDDQGSGRRERQASEDEGWDDEDWVDEDLEEVDSEGDDERAAQGTVPHDPLNLLTAEGAFTLSLVTGINMSAPRNDGTSLVGDPVVPSPDIWYGASDRLSLGLVHSESGRSGFWQAGHSLCLLGESCGRPYKKVGALLRWSLVEGGAPLILDAGLDFEALWSPTAVRAKLGVRGQYRSGKVSIDYAPSFFLTAVADLVAGDFFNGDLIPHELSIPVSVGYWVADTFVMSLQSGIRGDITQLSANYQVPVAFGGMLQMRRGFWLGGTLFFPDLAGVAGSMESRSLQIVATLAL